MAEVIWTDDKVGVWLCKLCGVSRCYTRDSVSAAAAEHVCVVAGVEHWTDGKDIYRTCFNDERVLFMQVYFWDAAGRAHGWQTLERTEGLPFELCGAYWAPSQGGECDLPKDHPGDHHV